MDVQPLTREEFEALRGNHGVYAEMVDKFMASGAFAWKLIDPGKNAAIGLSKIIKRKELTNVKVKTVNKEVYLVRVDETP